MCKSDGERGMCGEHVVVVVLLCFTKYLEFRTLLSVAILFDVFPVIFQGSIQPLVSFPSTVTRDTLHYCLACLALRVGAFRAGETCRSMQQQRDVQ
jgi:hypothetical protein